MGRCRGFVEGVGGNAFHPRLLGGSGVGRWGYNHPQFYLLFGSGRVGRRSYSQPRFCIVVGMGMFDIHPRFLGIIGFINR